MDDCLDNNAMKHRGHILVFTLMGLLISSSGGCVTLALEPPLLQTQGSGTIGFLAYEHDFGTHKQTKYYVGVKTNFDSGKTLNSVWSVLDSTGNRFLKQGLISLNKYEGIRDSGDLAYSGGGSSKKENDKLFDSVKWERTFDITKVEVRRHNILSVAGSLLLAGPALAMDVLSLGNSLMVLVNYDPAQTVMYFEPVTQDLE